MLSEAPSGRPRRGDAVAPNALRRFGPRAVCRVPPTPPYPTPAPVREGGSRRAPVPCCSVAGQGSALLRAALRRAAFRLQARWRPESAPALIFCKGYLCGYSGEDIQGAFSGLKSWVCPFIPVQSPAEFSRLPTPRRLRATQEEGKKKKKFRGHIAPEARGFRPLPVPRSKVP